ncbi:MAG TPA: histidinol dehydrogenase [Chitinophagaceae bacterium]|nr:histidinol dehydrogenase [Chitinophagaceae bacterium]
MKVYRYPDKNDWKEILKRPSFDASALEQKVKTILDEVKTGGDIALKHFTKQFDGIEPDDLLVNESAINAAEKELSVELKQAILQAAANITRFHEKQTGEVEIIETMPGVQCWRKSVGIEKVGLYIPGGSAPLFSTLLMLAIPAKIAGCKEIILCTPPSSLFAGSEVHPAILFAAKTVGVTKIFKAGGVQAIGAMAYGTQTIPRVYKIFGPGNQYVTCAKQLIQKDGIAIDMPAGPSEVAVYADDTANPAFVAADLLSQAEHGADSQVILVVSHEQIVVSVEVAIEKQLAQLPRKEIAAKALENSKIIIVKDEDEAIDLLNEYAAEHLILSCTNADAVGEKIINAGSVFLGNYSPESAGDYASGTNHTLPTNGYAKAYSGVSVDSFVKKITYQKLTQQGLKNIGRTVEVMAAAEGLEAHKNAVSIRLREQGEKEQ